MQQYKRCHGHVDNPKKTPAIKLPARNVLFDMKTEAYKRNTHP